MKKAWLKLASHIDALSKRERVILFVLVFVGGLFLANSIVLSPMQRKLQLLELQMQQDNLRISTIKMEMQQLKDLGSVDVDADVKRQLVDIKRQLEIRDGELRDTQKNLVSPEKIDALLESMLRRNKALQIISLRSLPVVNLFADMDTSGLAIVNSKAGNENEAKVVTPIDKMERGIFKHEVELVLEGNYLDMLAYMRELESMPEQVYWSRSSLYVVEYPKSRLRLNLFTLSLEKKWLNL